MISECCLGQRQIIIEGLTGDYANYVVGGNLFEESQPIVWKNVDYWKCILFVNILMRRMKLIGDLWMQEIGISVREY